MIDGYHAVVQTFLGTLLTWGLTAAGAALVFVFDGKQVLIIFLFIFQRVHIILWHLLLMSIYFFIAKSFGWKPWLCCWGKKYF